MKRCRSPKYLFLFFLMFALSNTIQSTELKLISPLPDQYLIKGLNYKIKWEVNEKIDDLLSIEMINGTDQVTLGKNVKFSQGYCLFILPYSFPSSDNCKVVITSKNSSIAKAEIYPLTVTKQRTEVARNLFNKQIGWAPSLLIDHNSIKHVNLKKLITKGIYIDTVIDLRRHRKLVGALYTGTDWEYGYITTDTVKTWFATKLSALFNDLKIPSDKNSEYRVTVELLDFFVKEQDNYVGDIVGRTTIYNKNGTEIWKGITRGHHSVWGKTYYLENYQQCFADSFIMFSISLLENISLLQ